ncbi:MAG: NTP transferase domain-containing protein [Candidatus Marinimicrobia bacterium]|nr:NTP transferase domain-containing protein [Candidatus Neomarinimicrobiota bacterium]
MADQIAAFLLAAGKGTRMGEGTPKPLIKLRGKSIILHLIEAVEQAGIRDIYLIVGHRADEVQAALGNRVKYIRQEDQLGTAQAVETAGDIIQSYEQALVFVGDSPLLRSETIRRLIEVHQELGAADSFLTADFPIKLPYARVIRDDCRRLAKCVEQRDATPAELGVTELMTSHFLFDSVFLSANLGKIKPHPITGERYLTNLINIGLQAGETVFAEEVADYCQLVGLNTTADLAWAETILQATNG